LGAGLAAGLGAGFAAGFAAGFGAGFFGAGILICTMFCIGHLVGTDHKIIFAILKTCGLKID
jgi:threonine/homoserine/homoserine lactone efflux protein